MEFEEEGGGWVWVRGPKEGDLEWWGGPSSSPSSSSVEEDQNGPNSAASTTVVFTEPAKHWTDAVPIGNGRLGAMVWGGVRTETLQLNGNTAALFSFFIGWPLLYMK